MPAAVAGRERLGSVLIARRRDAIRRGYVDQGGRAPTGKQVEGVGRAAADLGGEDGEMPGAGVVPEGMDQAAAGSEALVVPDPPEAGLPASPAEPQRGIERPAGDLLERGGEPVFGGAAR